MIGWLPIIGCQPGWPMIAAPRKSMAQDMLYVEKHLTGDLPPRIVSHHGEDPSRSAGRRRSRRRAARARDGQSALHPRDDGARAALHRRAGVGAGGDRRHRRSLAAWLASRGRRAPELAGDLGRRRRWWRWRIGVVTTALKARASGDAAASGPGRKFVLSFAPPLVVGALLTVVLFRARADGAAARACGCCSTAPASCTRRRVLGAHRAGDGALLHGRWARAALFAPPGVGRRVDGRGFGGLHVVFGVMIARRHGG